MGFKTDTSFLRFLSMGAKGVSQTIAQMEELGFRPIELERYCSSNKIWTTKVKRLRLPDLLCVKTGLRLEVRAKSDLKIRMSDAPNNPDRVPLSQIYGVATFYSTFSLKPRGRNIISICLGTACHVRGGERVRERIQDSLNIGDGETTEDMRFTFETVRCIGCCSLGPVVKINEDMHGHISSDKVNNILDLYE